jgi:putative hydrolase of the HAD superfamily
MKKLAKRLRLGLVSNFDDSETGHLIMHDTGIRDLFDAVIISADTGYRKPNPLIFKRILEILRLEPADILFVGDTPLDDVMGSKGVGMHSAWIRTGGRELPEGIPAPDIVISDLAELPDVLGLQE